MPADTWVAIAAAFELGVATTALEEPSSRSAASPARVIAVPWPRPRCSRRTPIGSISPGRPVPADHTVMAATATSRGP